MKSLESGPREPELLSLSVPASIYMPWSWILQESTTASELAVEAILRWVILEIREEEITPV